MSTVSKVIKMFNNCNSAAEVQQVWMTVCGWSLTDEEFETLSTIAEEEFAAWA